VVVSAGGTIELNRRVVSKKFDLVTSCYGN